MGSKDYRLVRHFNNNVVEATEGAGRHVVLSGKGIGFGLHKGDAIDADKVSLRYIPENSSEIARISATLADIPDQVLVIARYATILGRDEWGLSGKISFELALADHLASAMRRAEQGYRIELPILSDLAQLYPREVEFGRAVVEAVRARTGVALPKDEAGAIALHAVNDQFSRGSETLPAVVTMTRVIDATLEIIARRSGRAIDLSGAAPARFITHMRYLYRRLEDGVKLQPSPPAVIDAVKESLASSWEIALEIAGLFEREAGFRLGESETAYVTLHVGRLLS